MYKAGQLAKPRITSPRSLYLQLIALIRAGRLFAHKNYRTDLKDIGRFRRSGVRCLREVGGKEDSIREQRFVQLSGQAFLPLLHPLWTKCFVDKDGSDTNDQDLVTFFDPLSVRHAVQILIDAAHEVRRALAREEPSAEPCNGAAHVPRTRTAATAASKPNEPQSSGVANDGGMNRRAEVDDFLNRCNKVARVKIKRAHIWRAAKHAKARQFQYWQAGQDRLPRKTRGATAEDELNFRRILAMNPADFIELLETKGLIQAKP
jgi:hypothetical protein